MGVYIKDLEMPKNCMDCKLRLCDCCVLSNQYIADLIRENPDERPDSCPLREVSILKEHGDLIDRDQLEPDAEYDDGEFWAYSQTQIRTAPAVIPRNRNTEDNKVFEVGQIVCVSKQYVTYTEIYPVGTQFRISRTKTIKDTGDMFYKLLVVGDKTYQAVIVPHRDMVEHFDVIA